MTDHNDRLADLLVLWDDAKSAGRPLAPQALCHDAPHLLGPFTELLRRLGRVAPILKGTAPPVGPGAQVIDAGRFAPITFHDEGGLGVVYLAEDAELKRAVALKWMKPLPGLDPAARRRFLQEAEITGKLEHPGVAPVYGAGHDPHGRPYYAMRFIHGTRFGDAIERLHARPATDPARAVEFGRLLRAFVSVCQTVAYAHARGIAHRDLKPGNIMLGPYGETLVVDWGLAKRIDPPRSDETVDVAHAPVELHLAAGGESVYGQVKGSPAYMAPEQAQGQTDAVGPAADVYALGATLYALLTGRAPYTGPSAAAVVEQVKRSAPRPPRGAAAGVPRPLDAKSTTAEIQSALDHFLAGDRAAKAELVNRSGERLMILARKLLRGFGSGPEETAAVVSEAYLKLHTALDEVRPATVRQFFGLASLQMRRVLLDLVRASKRAGRAVNDDSGPFDTPDSADGQSEADLVTDLYSAIGALGDELKEVVMLRYFQGLTQAETGELLGVHEDTVKRRWAKARVILAGKLAAFDPGAG